MSDTTNVASDITPGAISTQVLNDIELGKQVAALLAKGDKLSAIKLLVENRATVEQQVKEVEAAIPAIKAGYKTTEFWIVVIYVLINVVFTYLKVPLPLGDDITIGAIIAAYGTNRQIQKTQAQTP